MDRSKEDKNEAPHVEGVRWEEGVAVGIQTCRGAPTSFFQLAVGQLDQLSPAGSTLSDTFLNQFWLSLQNLQTASPGSLKLFEEFESATKFVYAFLTQKKPPVVL